MIKYFVVYSLLDFFSNKLALFNISLITGPATFHFKSVASFSQIPIAPLPTLTSLLFSPSMINSKL